MTLNASGPIGIGNGVSGQDIALEFGLSANSVFPTAFYGKGGAPASGALSFSDFYGRTNFSASASPDPTTGFGATALITGGPCTITPAGGVGPFTYAWVKGPGDSITAVSPSSAATNFQATGMSSGETRVSDFNWSVTDTSNGQVRNGTISVQLSRA